MVGATANGRHVCEKIIKSKKLVHRMGSKPILSPVSTRQPKYVLCLNKTIRSSKPRLKAFLTILVLQYSAVSFMHWNKNK